jgi:DNA-binding MarR family transcriptional regulator
MKLTQAGGMAAMPSRNETMAESPAGSPAGGPGAPSGNPPGGSPPGPVGAGRNLLFLREEELRLAQDLLFFGYREFTAGPDRLLEELGMGRAHHRVLHFVGRRPGITVGELLGILSITKQSLGRVLTPLVEQGYVTQAPGRNDRRQRLLSLTEKGATLERRLFERQRETVMRAYREAGPAAVDGFRRVMRGLMGAEARGQFDRLEGSAAATTPAATPVRAAGGGGPAR